MAEESAPPLGRQALAQLHQQDEQAGVSPWTVERAPSQPSTYGPPLVIPRWEDPADTSFVEPIRVREPDPALHTEDEQTLPAKPRSKSATPNLDRWRRELMRPAS